MTHPSQFGAASSDSLQTLIRQLLASAQVQPLHLRAMPRNRLRNLISRLGHIAEVERDELHTPAQQLDESIRAQVLAPCKCQALQPSAGLEPLEDLVGHVVV